MTDAELDAIERRAAAATPAPWCAIEASWGGVCGEPTALTIEGVVGTFLDDRAPRARQQRANFLFIASARADVPALVNEVRWYRDELSQLVRAIALATLQPADDSPALEKIMAAVQKLTISAEFRAALAPPAGR